MMYRARVMDRREVNTTSNRGILRTKSVAHCVHWTVDEYQSIYLSTESSMCSDIFRVPTFPSCLFYLSLRIDDDKYLISVNRLIKNRASFLSKCSSVNICLVIQDTSWDIPRTENIQMENDTISSTVAFKRERDTSYSAKSNLEVKCTITINATDSFFPSQVNCAHNRNNKEYVTVMSTKELKDNLDVLLEGENDSKVVLIAGEDKFTVHKSILCSHSPIFKAMFDHETLENSTKEIKIVDISPETIGEMLKFIYFGTTSDMPVEMAMDIYIAADKYAILSLKKKCFDVLTKKLTKNVLLEVFKIADRHFDVELKQVATQFLINEATDIIQSEEFLFFIENEPDLARNIILNLTKMVPKC